MSGRYPPFTVSLIPSILATRSLTPSCLSRTTGEEGAEDEFTPLPELAATQRSGEVVHEEVGKMVPLRPRCSAFNIGCADEPRTGA